MRAVVATLACLGCADARASTIRVQSTTDTVDAGLVEGLLRPAYLAAQPDDTLSYVGVGTGAALTNARNGLADVVVTHAPSLERQFVADGYSLEPYGRAIFYSDYVIIGPLDDPAHVQANHPHDAIGAFEDIETAGDAGTVNFLSRANNSGTSVQEQTMWGLTGPSVPKAPGFDAGTDTTRLEPTVAGSSPAAIAPWYHRNPSGQAANIQATSTCAFDAAKCYTMTDRGTFTRLVDAGTITNLKIVSDRNTPGARGGQDLLINPFSIYILNPAKTYPSGVTPDTDAARRLVDFVTSPAFRTSVNSFPSAVDPAFHADAFASVTLATPLPPTAAAGSMMTIDARISNELPGAPAVDGMSVQLQGSTDGGATYADIGAPASTSAAGAVTFTPTISATTSYRLSMPLHPTSSVSPNAFSPNTQDIGIVSLAAGSPPPAAAKDTTAPRVTHIALRRRWVSASISEPGTVHIRVSRRIKRPGRRAAYRSVRLVAIKATKAGTIIRSWSKSLPRGRYRLRVRGTDGSSNTHTRIVVR